MDELIVFLKIGLLIFSVIAVISHMSSKSDAKSKTQDLIDEQGDQSDQHTTDEERTALNKAYDLKLSAPCSVIELEGDLNVSVLTTNGAASSHLVTIDGNQVQIPKDQIVGEVVLLPSQGVARLAIVESKLYLLSLGDYRIVEQVRSNMLQDKTTQAMVSHTQGKIDSLPLEVIGHREATELERWHFDPAIAGKRYAIPMMVAFAIASFVLHDGENQDYLTWAITFGSITLIGFGMWFYSVKRARSRCEITRMQGQFNEVAASDAIGVARVSDDNETQGWVDFQFPANWVDHFKINALTEFEVSKEGNQIVSLIGGPSLDQDLRTEPPTQRRCYGWMSMTLVVLVASVLLTLNGPQLHLMKDIVKSIDEVDLNAPADWQGELYAGQRIHAKNLSRVCIPPEPINEYRDLVALCDQAYLVEGLPTLDLFSLIEPKLQALADADKSLKIETISNSDYSYLQMSLMMRGERAISQSQIIVIDYATLNAWAVWAETLKGKEAYSPLKTAILSQWSELKGIDDCESACWEELLSNDTATFGEYGSIGRRSDLRNMTDAKEQVLKGEIKSMVNLWIDQLREQANQYESHIEIDLIDQPQFTNGWTELMSHLDGYQVDSVEGYTYLLKRAASDLQAMQSTSIDYGVIQSVSDTQPKRIEIYTQFSEPQYQTLLVKEVLLLLSMVMLLLFLLLARTSRKHEAIV